MLTLDIKKRATNLGNENKRFKKDPFIGSGGLMQIRPLQDRVLVKRLEAESKTKSGIIIPDNNKEKPAEGEVVAVGTGHRLQDGSVRMLDVKVGDRILFSKYAGTEIKIDAQEFLIMREDDILGVLDR